MTRNLPAALSHVSGVCGFGGVAGILTFLDSAHMLDAMPEMLLG